MVERLLNAMDRSTLYFRLSVIWLGLLFAVLACALFAAVINP